jgi:hypothetical protein
VPGVVRAEVVSGDVPVLQPPSVPKTAGGSGKKPAVANRKVRVYAADAIVVLYGANDVPLLAVVVEVQRDPYNAEKELAWTTYLSYTRRVRGVKVPLLVFTFSPTATSAIARKLADNHPHGLQVQALLCCCAPGWVPMTVSLTVPMCG